MTFEVRATRETGLGCFATSDIPEGTRILAEEAFLITRRIRGFIDFQDSYSQYQGLTAKDQSLYESLAASPTLEEGCYERARHEYPPETARHVARVTSIFDANAFAMEGSLRDDRYTESAIFKTTSRFNHSCAPNAVHIWNPKIRRMTVHATRPISNQEEICLSYIIRPAVPRWERQIRLSGLNFTCRCTACESPMSQRECSDRRREKVVRLGHDIQFAKARYHPDVSTEGPLCASLYDSERRLHPLLAMDEACQLLRDEGLFGHEGLPWLEDILNSHKQTFPDSELLLARAREYYDLIKTMKGQDHPETADMAEYKSGLESRIYEIPAAA